MPSLRSRILVAVSLSLAIAACGGSSARSVAGSRAGQTLTRAFHALASGDGATVCGLATPAGRRSLASAVPGSSCAKVVSLVSAHLTPAQKAALGTVQVKRVAVSGAEATVRAADIASKRGSFRGFLSVKSAPTKLHRQADGSWKIEG